MKTSKTLKKILSLLLIITFSITSNAYSYQSQSKTTLRSPQPFGADKEGSSDEFNKVANLTKHYELDKVILPNDAIELVQDMDEIDVLIGDGTIRTAEGKDEIKDAVELIKIGKLDVGHKDNKTVIVVRDTKLTAKDIEQGKGDKKDDVDQGRRSFLGGLLSWGTVLVTGVSLASFLNSCSENSVEPDDNNILYGDTYAFMEKNLFLDKVSSNAANWIKNQISGGLVISYGDINGHGSDGVAWSFDQGTTMVVFAKKGGEFLTIAKNIADLMLLEQGGDGLWKDGRRGIYIQEKDNKLVGNVVTIARGLVEVGLEESNDQYIESATKAGDALISKYWNELGSDKGFFKGGFEYGKNASWTSTEHNARAGIFFYRLWKATGDEKYKDVALKIASWFKDSMWAGDHFYVGYDNDTNINYGYNQDADAQVMPILLFNMLAKDGEVGSEFDPAKFNTLAWLDKNYKKKITFTGTDGTERTVELYGKVKGVNHIWPEVSANVAVACEVWGNDTRKNEILQDIAKIQYVNGGIGYTLPVKNMPYGWPDNFPHPSIASSISFIAAQELGPDWFPKAERKTNPDLGVVRKEKINLEDVAIGMVTVAITKALTDDKASSYTLDGEPLLKDDKEFLTILNDMEWLDLDVTMTTGNIYNFNLNTENIDPIMFFSGDYVINNDMSSFIVKAKEALGRNEDQSIVILAATDQENKSIKDKLDTYFPSGALNRDNIFVVTETDPVRIQALLKGNIYSQMRYGTGKRVIKDKNVVMSYGRQI
ncbi:MAG: hypothetical protein ABH848_05815 [Candidatus Omnitrophota bacterium]